MVGHTLIKFFRCGKCITHFRKEPRKPSSNRVKPHHSHYFKENRNATKTRFHTLAHISDGSCLNNIFYSALSMLPLLFHILITFPTEKTANIADVKQIFVQIEIDKQHCIVLRFM